MLITMGLVYASSSVIGLCHIAVKLVDPNVSASLTLKFTRAFLEPPKTNLTRYTLGKHLYSADLLDQPRTGP